MLPTVAVANDGARALLLFTLASAARAGAEAYCTPTAPSAQHTRCGCMPAPAPSQQSVRMPGVRRPHALISAGGCCFCPGLEDPCKYTPDGFERTRSPCGENGICSVASSWNELAPHQRSFNCTCLGNYIGDRCERCDHGYTFESGCEGAMPAAAATSLATAWTSPLTRFFLRRQNAGARRCGLRGLGLDHWGNTDDRVNSGARGRLPRKNHRRPRHRKRQVAFRPRLRAPIRHTRTNRDIHKGADICCCFCAASVVFGDGPCGR
eukprot:COSAG02_NODE_384_length_23406_cov_9.459733_22_plen_265_part_00